MDEALIAGEAIACDEWVVRAPQDGKAYGFRGFDDGKLVIGKARQSFRAGDEIMTDELYWPEKGENPVTEEATGFGDE